VSLATCRLLSESRAHAGRQCERHPSYPAATIDDTLVSSMQHHCGGRSGALLGWFSL
jgi:hypothetical protein